VTLGVILAVVDPDDDGEVGLLARRGDQHLARTALEVGGGVLAGAEFPGGLDHDADSEAVPVDPGRVAGGKHRDRHAIHGERVRPVLHDVAEPAVGGVEFQQVRQRAGVGEVIDRHDLQIVALQRTPHERPADAPEAINSHPDRHGTLLCPDCCGGLAARPGLLGKASPARARPANGIWPVPPGR